jgi:PhnB protein
MVTINPYLNFPGNTEEAFNFYRSVFGGEFMNLQRFKDTPEKDRVPAHEQNKLMHVALPVGANILMGTDALESMGHRINIGSNMSISVSTQSEEEATTIFNALAAGGKVSVPLAKNVLGGFFRNAHR